MNNPKHFLLTGLNEFNVRGNEIDVWADEVSDGYHTMSELYDHRRALTIALFNLIENSSDCHDIRCYKSKNHHPESDSMFEGYFIVWCMDTDKNWTSYHYELKYWDDFTIPEAMHSPKYPDKHKDAIEFLPETVKNGG